MHEADLVALYAEARDTSVRKEDHVPRLDRALRMLLLCFPIVMAVALAVQAVDLPFEDEWDWTNLIYHFHVGSLTFAEFWQQHNEHRMLVPNLIAVGLVSFGGWDPVRELFVSLAVLIVTQMVIVMMMDRSARGIVATLGAVLASFLLFGFWQYECLGWGFQTAWFICNAAAAAVALLLGCTQRSRSDVVIAMCCAIVASVSSSQGLVVWVTGGVAIILLQRRAGVTLFAWVLVGGVTVFVVRAGLFPIENGGRLSLIAHPRIAAEYIFAYIGAPLFEWAGVSSSICAGALVIIALVAAFAFDVFARDRVRRLVRRGRWYALASYPLIVAVATASGRAGFGLGQAFSSRYTTVATFAYIAAVGLAVSFLSRLSLYRARVRGSVGLSIAGLLVVICLSDYSGWSKWNAFSANLRDARASIIANDMTKLSNIYPKPAAVMQHLSELRGVHDWLFTQHQ